MKRPSNNIAVRKSKKRRLQEYIERTQPVMITPAQWSDIARELAPVSESYLRDLLRNCGIALHPLIEGVRQDTFENLERTLLQLHDQYESGDPAAKQTCRVLVIQAKDHARFVLSKKPEKEEMLLWMTTWLENPPAFPTWLTLRKDFSAPA